MPQTKVTAAASRLIAEGTRAKKSSTQIAETLRKKLKIELDPRTIQRHADSLGGKRRERAKERARAERGDPKTKKAERLGAPATPAEPTLDEIAALETQARKIQECLAGDVAHRDRVALNAELRATFASLRVAQAAKRDVSKSENANAKWVVEKLRRFEKMNGGAGEDDERGVQDPGGVPEAAGATAGD